MSATADRVLRILGILAEAGQPLSVTDMAARLRVEKSTASRLLRTLERHQVVERDGERGKFALGLRLVELARVVLNKAELRHVAPPLMLALRDRTNESVHLAVLRGEHVIYIDKVEAPTFVRTRTEVGDLAPPHCTATGKAILAFMDPLTLRRWLRRRKLPLFTSKTMTSVQELLNHLARTRAQGYALDEEEYVPGVRCVASPILNHTGEVLGSIGVSGLAIRLTGAHLRKVITAVMDTAHAISRRLGGKARGGQNNPEPLIGSRRA